MTQDIYDLTFICMMDDAHIMGFVDVETGNFISEEERANVGKLTL